VLQKDEESAHQFFLRYLAIGNLAKTAPKEFDRLNAAPTFWNANSSALQLAAFISLGRIFDQTSPHNIDKLLKTATDNIGMFSAASLSYRKTGMGLDATHLTAYMADVHVPTAVDFRKLRAKVKECRKIYTARYKDVRDKIFAHNEIADRYAARQLMSQTNIEEMKQIFIFLKAFGNTMFHLFHNGREPVLDVRPFGSPPPTPVGPNEPDEQGQIASIIDWEMTEYFDRR
jgi:hypothetical protein